MISRQRLVSLAPYAPLAAVGLQLVWTVFLFLFVLFLVGDEPFTASGAQERAFTFVAAILAAAGLFLGILCIVQKWVRRPVQWICLISGSLICAIIVGCLVSGVIE